MESTDASASEKKRAEVGAMTPREALDEVERYIRASAQKRAFGKTRVLAALRVLEDHVG